MIRHERTQTSENLAYYSYKLFEPFPQVPLRVSTRLGGVSQGHLHSLNLSLSESVGDDPDAVITNRTRFYEIVDVKPEQVAQAQLVHGSHVEIVTEQTPCGTFQKLPKTDGLVTKVPGRALFIPVADCAAIAFYDPNHQVIAMIHAGWRGTVKGIIPETVKTMKQLGSNPVDILVGISPLLGTCCYQVREDLVATFTEAFPSQARYFFAPQADDTYLFDIAAVFRWQLLESGVRLEHIEESGICTACHTNLFYSYHAEQGKTGRFAGLIVLHV
jgi:polyphenol oxidase